MCGRFSQLRAWAELVRLYRITETDEAPNWPPRYNVAPTQPVAVVVGATGDRRRLQTMRWGLVPAWAKDLAAGARMINARAESVTLKPAFREAMKRRRCVIPADGFYEWWKHPGGRKQPYWITWRERDPPAAFAGLWESWLNPADGRRVLSCTIITTQANTCLRPLHDRMPALLDATGQEAWLDVESVDHDEAQRLLRPWDAAEMRAQSVSTWVNSAANEGPRCLDPSAEVASPLLL